MRMFRRTRGRFKALLLAGGVLMLHGCGFHLRGAYQVPSHLTPAYVEAPETSLLAAELRQALADAGVQLAPSPAAAEARIRILGEKYNTRVLSVDGQGKVVEFELRYNLKFDVQGGSGRQLVPRQDIVVVQTQINPDIEVLGKQQEEELLREDMRRDMVGRMLQRMRAHLAKS
jgi:LPS-assembly lipoprotein